MDYKLNIKCSYMLMSLMDGANDVISDTRKSHRDSRAEGSGASESTKAWRYFALERARAVHASLHYNYKKNRVAELRPYISGGDALQKAEYAVDKAKAAEAKAEFELAVINVNEAEKVWLAK